MVWIVLLTVALAMMILSAIFGLGNYVRLGQYEPVFSMPSLFRRGDSSKNRPESVRSVPREAGIDQYEFLYHLGYQLGETLGAGAYAVVKEAYSHKLKKKVAIKIVDKKDVAPKTADKFLWREIEVLKRVDHKHVIRVYEVIDCGHNLYIAMELAPNGDLLQMIQKRGFLHENDARKLFKKILKGVLHCHKKGE